MKYLKINNMPHSPRGVQIKPIRIKGYAVMQDNGNGYAPIVIVFGGETLMSEHITKARTAVAEITMTLRNALPHPLSNKKK